MSLSVILYIWFTEQNYSVGVPAVMDTANCDIRIENKTGTATMWPVFGLMINSLKEKSLHSHLCSNWFQSSSTAMDMHFQ